MTQIGRYEVKRRTGSHGTAALYEAFDPVMKRSVTIRIAEGEPEAGAHEESFDPHQMAGLDHPNIIRVLACEEDGARPYLVMEQFEGQPLSTVLSEQPNLNAAKVSEILKGAASALDHVHAQGLIHNRLTPDSIVLSDDGLIKISGFEVACLPEQAYADQEDQAYPLESIAYMPPEFLKGERVDARADQFSLAAIAFHALTGTRPFQAKSDVALLRQVMFEKPTLGKLRDLFPLAVTKVFETALSATPSARYASCSDFATALAAAVIAPAAAPTRIAAAPPTRQVEVPAVPAGSGSNKWLIWVVGFVVVAGLASLAVKLLTTTPPAVVTQPPQQTQPAPTVTPVQAPTPPKSVPTAKSGKPKSNVKQETKAPKAPVGASTGTTTVAEPAPTPKQPVPEKAVTPVTPPAAQPTPPKPAEPTVR